MEQHTWRLPPCSDQRPRPASGLGQVAAPSAAQQALGRLALGMSAGGQPIARTGAGCAARPIRSITGTGPPRSGPAGRPPPSERAAADHHHPHGRPDASNRQTRARPADHRSVGRVRRPARTWFRSGHIDPPTSRSVDTGRDALTPGCRHCPDRLARRSQVSAWPASQAPTTGCNTGRHALRSALSAPSLSRSPSAASPARPSCCADGQAENRQPQSAMRRAADPDRAFGPALLDEMPDLAHPVPAPVADRPVPPDRIRYRRTGCDSLITVLPTSISGCAHARIRIVVQQPLPRVDRPRWIGYRAAWFGPRGHPAGSGPRRFQDPDPPVRASVGDQAAGVLLVRGERNVDDAGQHAVMLGRPQEQNGHLRSEPSVPARRPCCR